MMKYSIILYFLFCTNVINAQLSLERYQSSVTHGIANIQTATTFTEKPITSPTQLVQLNSGFVAVNAHNAYLIDELNTIALNAGYSFKSGGWGIRGKQFGDKSLYQSQQISLDYAKQLAKDNYTAITINYHVLKIPTVALQQTVSIDISSQQILHPKFTLGVKIKNISNQNYNQYRQLTTSIQLGGNYITSQKVILHYEFAKAVQTTHQHRIALSYLPHESILIQGGFQSSPSLASLGTSIEWKGINLSISTQFLQQLGLSYAGGLIFEL